MAFPGEEARLCKHRDHISHLHWRRMRFYGLVLGQGGGGARGRGAALFWCCPSPGSLCKCKQSPMHEDQHLFRHICMPGWEIHPPLHSIVSSSLLGLA